MDTTETTRPSEHPRLTASELAAQLGEIEPIPRKHLKRALRILGPERTQALLDQTMETERNGGLMLSDGSRRRTPGGVFFHLIRTTVGTHNRWDQGKLQDFAPSDQTRSGTTTGGRYRPFFFQVAKCTHYTFAWSALGGLPAKAAFLLSSEQGYPSISTPLAPHHYPPTRRKSALDSRHAGFL